MHRLNYELKHLGLRNRDGSFVTQANRAYMLSLMANQLYELGYKKLHAHELKGRHVNALVRRWQAEGLAPGTVKNRLSVIRWWAEKVGRATVLADDNTAYGVPARRTVAATSKARVLEADKLAAIRDPYVRLSLELQRAFGLRREEGVKIKQRQADHGDRLVLQGSWTKGGRPGEVPIRSATCSTAPRRWPAPALSSPRPGATSSSGGCTSARRRGSACPKCMGCGTPMRRNALRSWRVLRHRPPAALRTPCSRRSSASSTPRRVWIITAELGHAREEITRMYLGR